ncbi:hypothetical protein OXYTRIMIC_689 [Oxytricha trifallax]|uniref:Ubiquitin-like protease family profile domain-containing protein n=1 Tax=Oxytricha trifallax TaxID=1172189 RepID=A0A073HYP3_9SPIT|nr:hypothetical protein OXYTRIMIC_689 [Oxytricha trifallax]
MKITENTQIMEMFDPRKQVASLAEIQKHLNDFNTFMKDTVWKKFLVNKVMTKPEVNQVKDPIDCGVMSILTANHLALELQGEPMFQIFAKDWVNMQRYYLAFNLEVGHMKLETGKSGITVNAEDTEYIAEKRNQSIWQVANEEKWENTTLMRSQIDNQDDLLLSNNRMELDGNQANENGLFSEVEENQAEVEYYLYPQQRRERGQSEPMNGGIAKPKLIQDTQEFGWKPTNRARVDDSKDKVETENQPRDVKNKIQNKKLNEEEAIVEAKEK